MEFKEILILMHEFDESIRLCTGAEFTIKLITSRQHRANASFWNKGVALKSMLKAFEY